MEGNSHKVKGDIPEKKPNQKPAIPEKKAKASFTDKAENFITPIIDDVIIPGAEDMICDIANGLLSNIYNSIVTAVTHQPSNKRISVPTRHDRNGRTNYNKISSNSSRVKDERNVVKETYYVKDLRVNSREDAISVVEQAKQICEEYGRLDCNTFYSLEEIGKTAPYVYANWGWTNLDDAGIIGYPDGTYGFDFPNPKQLPQ